MLCWSDTKQEVWRGTMSTKKFEATPTPSESISLDTISKENVQDAWKEYEAKPEYKEFNKHDMIESMQPQPKPES